MPRSLTTVLLLCSILIGTGVPLSAQEKVKGKGKRKSAAMAPVVEEKEDASRVVLAFDPGSHTRPISALGFNSDQSRLITVGWDYSIQIWCTKTGERLDIIRLPAFGRDNGFDSNRWDQAAISADGAYVAMGGGPKLLFDDKGIPTRLVVVDMVNRRIRKLLFPADIEASVTCLSFSANGDRLAVGFGGVNKSVYILDDVQKLMTSSPEIQVPAEPVAVVNGLPQDPHYLTLSRTGNKLAFNDRSSSVMSWDVTGKASGNWKKLGEFSTSGTNDTLTWSPDESQFVWSWRQEQDYWLELRTPEGQLIRNWSFRDLKTGFGESARVANFQYIDAERLFISAHAVIKGQGRGCVGVLLNPKTGETFRHFYEDSSGTYRPLGTVAPAGSMAATTTQLGLEAAIYSLIDGKTIARCGSRSPVPTIVGWSKEGKSPAIAWSDDSTLNPWNAKTDDLKYGFDLSRMEPTADVVSAGFDDRRIELGAWKLTWAGAAHNYIDVRLTQSEAEVGRMGRPGSLTLVPDNSGRPLVAVSNHDLVTNMGSFASLRDATGKVLTQLLPVATQHRDMVSSPDGRYLLMSTGTHRLSIYRTDGSRFPVLNVVQVNGEWACWAPEGYYAASPGGERMIGWSESRGGNDFPVFHPAEKFASDFRRPDILILALKTGSVSEALKSLKTETRAVEEILPPKCELKLLMQSNGHVKVQASAVSETGDKPIVALRLLLDGRPLAGGTGQKNVATGEEAKATWELDVPSGNHELKVLARTADNSVVSEPLVVKSPQTAGQQPVLHRLCVGVDQYVLPALNLQAAAKDATDVYTALEKNCVGVENRFGTCRGALLINEKATRESVLNAIAEIRRTAKPGDLVVFLFAGHGIKQKEEFYLMTHEADPSQNLKGNSLAGEDLRQSLADIECPVFLVMDACHSASGVKSFRPATDELTRSLTDVSAGVTVLAAAMSHEVASATIENGHFTNAFLKALELGHGVPYDPHEHLLYTHHVYSVVYSEVRKATNGRQNPFLSMPWTVPPLAIRHVPR